MPKEPMYEKFAGEYAVHAANGAYNALYDRPAMLDLAGDVSETTVLDAGCGAGLYAEEFIRSGATVIGFDQSPALVSLARERVGSRADLRVHDLAAPLDWLADQCVDLIVLALVYHYVDDRTAMLREFHRVLRTSGAVLISTAHPTADWLRLGGSYFAIEAVEESLSPRNDWPIRAWRQPLTATCREFFDAGFVIEKLVEPQPTAQMERRFPKDYASLSVRPGFINFRLRPA